MADPYVTLGVEKNATEEDIRKAYKKLAKKHHPDLNPGDKEAEDRFKDISAAYALLNDSEKRRAFDAGEIDEQGQPKPERRFYRDYADAGAGFRYERAEDLGDLGDLFGDLFSRRAQGGEGARTQFRMRGTDVNYTLPIDFLEAVNGGKKRVDMPDGKTLDISIPAGVRDEQIIRLKGQGGPGIGGAPSGDALITVIVGPHPVFRRDGNDIKSVAPITLSEALNLAPGWSVVFEMESVPRKSCVKLKAGTFSVPPIEPLKEKLGTVAALWT